MDILTDEETLMLEKLSKPIISFDKLDKLLNNIFPAIKNIKNKQKCKNDFYFNTDGPHDDYDSGGIFCRGDL